MLFTHIIRYIIACLVVALIFTSSLVHAIEQPFFRLDIEPDRDKWIHVNLFPDSSISESFVSSVGLRNQAISEKERVGGQRRIASSSAGYHGGVLGVAIANGIAKADRNKAVRKPISDFLSTAGSDEFLRPLFEELMIEVAVVFEQDVDWERLVPSVFPDKRKPKWKQPVMRLSPTVRVASSYAYFDIELEVEILNENFQKQSKQRVFEGLYAYRVTAEEYVDNFDLGEFRRNLNEMEPEALAGFLSNGFKEIQQLFFLDIEKRLKGEVRTLNRAIRYENKIANFYLRGNLISSEDYRLVFYELDGRLVNVSGVEVARY